MKDQKRLEHMRMQQLHNPAAQTEQEGGCWGVQLPLQLFGADADVCVVFVVEPVGAGVLNIDAWDWRYC